MNEGTRGEVTETSLLPLLVLSAALVGGWTIWALSLRPWLGASASGATAGLLARVLFWLVPSGIYLARFWGKRWTEPLGLGFPLGTPQVLRTISLTFVVAGFFVVGTAAQLNISVMELLGRLGSSSLVSLSAPLTEELVFRGLLLSEMINWARDSSDGRVALRLRFWGAMVLSALVFVLVHWPLWIGHLGLMLTLERSAPLFAIGVILGFVFANTRSVWACVLLHLLNNQLSLLGAAGS